MRCASLTVVLSTVAWAGLGGQISLIGQGVALDSTDITGTSRQSGSALLQENLSLFYSGMPFGPSVALLSAGLQASNVNSWSTNGQTLTGRTATLDTSIGLLPRRSLPIRVYARGTVSEAGPQSIPTLGGRESLAFGANLNLEPGGWLPHVRADFEEQRFTGPGAATLGDTRRFASLILARPFGAHLVTLTTRFDQEDRTSSGRWLGLAMTANWASPTHQTTVFGNYVERALRFVAPGLPSATTERGLRLEHVQRLSPAVVLEARGRASDARFDTGDGALGGLGVGMTARPFEAHDLQLSVLGDLGLTHTSATGDGQSAGISGRAAYARALGPVRAGLGLGGGTQWCGCNGLTAGLLSSFEVGASASLVLQNLDSHASYRLLFVDAPAGRGGKRTEHHLLLSAHTRLLTRADVSVLVGYDDGFRDYIDVRSQGLASIHEVAFFGGGGVSVALPRGWVSVDGRYSRGNALIPQTPFVDGPPPTARQVVSFGLNGALPVSAWLDLSVGGQAAWTSIDDARPLTAFSGTAGLTVHAGRISALLSYVITRQDTQGNIGVQHLLRLSLSRPFEVFE